MGLFLYVFGLLLKYYNTLQTELNKRAKRKKNAEHTRMYTIFRNFLHQYSRQLLSILAQHKTTGIIKPR